MRYEIDTLQYGEYKDTYKHENMESLLGDLSNLKELRTVKITEIRENGKPISKIKMKIISSLALK